MSPAGL